MVACSYLLLTLFSVCWSIVGVGVCYPLLALTPSLLWSSLLYLIAYDVNVCLEWLMEPDTPFLQYLLK